MKKIIMLLVIMNFTLLTIYSQSLGVKIGSTFSRSSGYSNLTGLNIGVIYSHSFKNLQLTIEPSYNQKGFSEMELFTDPQGNPITNNKIKYKFNYLDVPITFGYFNQDKKLNYGFNLGLAPSFLINAKTTYTGYDKTIKGINTFNLDALAGAKAGIKLSDNININLNLRYGKALLNLSDNYLKKYSYFSLFLELAYKF